jgi:Transposase domain (DUF772)
MVSEIGHAPPTRLQSWRPPVRARPGRRPATPACPGLLRGAGRRHSCPRSPRSGLRCSGYWCRTESDGDHSPHQPSAIQKGRPQRVTRARSTPGDSRGAGASATPGSASSADFASVGSPSTPSSRGMSPPARHRQALLATWHDLSDVKLSDAIEDRSSFRRFCGFSTFEPTPERTAFVRFRAELVGRGLDRTLFEVITRQLDAKGVVVRTGTLVDATLIASASVGYNDEAAAGASECARAWLRRARPGRGSPLHRRYGSWRPRRAGRLDRAQSGNPPG